MQTKYKKLTQNLRNKHLRYFLCLHLPRLYKEINPDLHKKGYRTF